MTELELLQQRHRDEAARRRAKVQERKNRTKRLIERGAILESALKQAIDPETISNKDVESLCFYMLGLQEVKQFIADIIGHTDNVDELQQG